MELSSKLDKKIDINSKAFFYGALSYDHIYTIAHAINSINSKNQVVTPQSLMDSLRKVDFNGVTGRVYFSQKSNDRINMPLQIMNSHGFDELSNSVKFESVATVSSDGNLVVDHSKILLPGY